MTSRFHAPALLVGVVAALTAVGCGTGAGAAPRHLADGVSPGLVLTMPHDALAWEYGRNDEMLNIDQPTKAADGLAVIITYDRRRTSNGRPREYSTTYTRTLTTRGTH